MLCACCKKELLGVGRKFVNEETNMTYYQHEDCWRKTYYESLYATSVVIRNAKEGICVISSNAVLVIKPSGRL